MADAQVGDEARFSGYAAYFEPLHSGAWLAEDGQRLLAEALRAERISSPSAEKLFRAAVERLVDAFLVDRSGQAECFTVAHAVGHHLAVSYGCPMTSDDDGYWLAKCGVLALHQRLGASFAGPSVGRCSVCGAGDFGCEHLPGERYDGAHCHRVVHTVELQEISLVQFPDDPRCYRVEIPVTPRQVREARRRPLRQGEVLSCTHCLTCRAIEDGPTREDIDQSVWPRLDPCSGRPGGA